MIGLSMIAAVVLARSGHRVVEGGESPDHVVQTGVFRYIRHPLYLASILFYLGLLLMTASQASALLWIVAVVFYNYISTYEENMLLRRFGNEYERYMARTDKWLPRVGKGDGARE